MDTMAEPISNMTSLSDRSVGAVNDNITALMASGHIWTSGCQAIGETMVASAQARLHRAISNWKAMAGIKSPKEAVELQSALSHIFMASNVADTEQLARALIKLREQTLAPIMARLELAADAFSHAQSTGSPQGR